MRESDDRGWGEVFHDSKKTRKDQRRGRSLSGDISSPFVLTCAIRLGEMGTLKVILNGT